MMDTSRESLIKELRVAAELLQIGRVEDWDGLAAGILQAIDMLETDGKARQVAVPATDLEIYTAYITATNQTLRPQDERLALKFARAIEAHHGITQGTKL